MKQFGERFQYEEYNDNNYTNNLWNGMRFISAMGTHTAKKN